MPRYFLELSYKGTEYSGFQLQANANTIQAEVEKAFEVLQKQKIIMTGSSRTDSGVHANQNYFHFDYEDVIHPHFIYKMNAILPEDIVLKKIVKVRENSHCRFDAVSREYKYYVYQEKNPFIKDRAFYFPYTLNKENLQKAAAIIMEYDDFTSFSKRHTQVKSFICEIKKSEWKIENGVLIYNVEANRFLRGMVRALASTLLKVGRNKLSIEEFKQIIESRNCTKASFAVPAHGLFLTAVNYPGGYWDN